MYASKQVKILLVILLQFYIYNFIDEVFGVFGIMFHSLRLCDDLFSSLCWASPLRMVPKKDGT